MQKLILILITMFSVTSLFAMQSEAPEVLEASFSAVKSIFLPAIVGMLLVLFADAKKHFRTPEWSYKIFFKTKIKPFLITSIGGIVLYLIIALFPFTLPFIEVLADSPLTEVSAFGFFGLASGVVDGFTKPK